jgi:hypothetical protein
VPAEAVLFWMLVELDQVETVFAVPVPVTPPDGVVHAKVARVPDTELTVRACVAEPIADGQIHV